MRYIIFCLSVLLVSCQDVTSYESQSLDDIDQKIVQLQSQLDELKKLRETKIKSSGPQAENLLVNEKSDAELLQLLTSDTTIIIKGRVDNELKNSSLKIYKDHSYRPDFVHKITIDADGKFSKEFTLKEEGVYSIKYGNTVSELYLVPGSTMGLVIDEGNENVFRYIGDHSKLNNFLVQRYLAHENWYDYQSDDFSKNLGDFIAFSNEKKDLQEKYLDEFLSMLSSEDALPGNYEKGERKEIMLAQARAFAEYDKNHLKMTGDKEAEQMDLSLVESVDHNDASLLRSRNFRKFLFNITREKAYRSFEAKLGEDEYLDQLEKYQAKYKMVNRMFTDAEVKSLMLTDVVYESLNHVKDIGINPLIKKYRRAVLDKDYVRSVDARYLQRIPVTDGSLAPNFMAKSLSGDEVELKDYRGKYVYLFLWASWCAPCKVELPHYEKLLKEHGEGNIEFIGLSIDEQKNDWENSFMYNKYPGSQIRVGGSENGRFLANYKINLIPQFILIGPDGEIISLNAPKPSKGASGYLSSFGV